MTDLLIRDPDDSGDVADFTRTVRLTVGEDTRVLSPYEMHTTPLLRLPVTDENPTVPTPATIGVVDPLRGDAAEYPLIRPVLPPPVLVQRGGRHRADRSGWWWFVSGVGMTLAAEAAFLAGLWLAIR